MAYGNGAATTDVVARVNVAPKAAEPKRVLSEKAIGKDGKIDWKHVDAEIERDGSKIVLPNDPAPMPIDDAIKALERKKADEEQMMAVHEVIDTFPLDGAVAFMHALKVKYGWASPVPTPGFFGPQPPQMLTVDIGPSKDDKVQVPWGAFMIPGIEKPVQTEVTRTEFGPALVIVGQLRKREAHILKDLAALTREIVETNSIYRGNAIRLRTTDNGDIEFRRPPTFIETKHVKPDELILPQIVKDQVETNIFTLIRKTTTCVKHGIPLKRGVLLEGKYGTGKTLTASVTAKHCVDHGWTFIMLDRCQGLRQAIEFAKRYQPAVIFAEDIDRAAETRDEKTNDLANIIDGMLSKDAQVMVVLTTNHVEKINPVMMRPGRLDAVISVTPPDAEAVEQLVRLYARGLLPKGEKLGKLGDQLAGNIPAMIREVVERSKMAMIARGGDHLTQDDLMISAIGMQNHMKLLEGPKKENDDPRYKLGDAMAKVLSGVMKDEFDDDDEDYDVTSAISDATRYIVNAVEDSTRKTMLGLSTVKDDTEKIRTKTVGK